LEDRPQSESTPDASADSSRNEAAWATARQEMVERQLRRRGIRDPRVLAAMAETPRHLFVDQHDQARAYHDEPLPIGHRQTISQPYIVALMTELAGPHPDAKVLEIGTGCGYQTAVLAKLCRDVYSIEVVPPLAESSRRRLQSMGYRNVHLRCGDGSLGWPEHAPFDAIVVAAAAPRIPPPLLDQLAPGGRLILPIGRDSQQLIVVEKQPSGRFIEQSITPVAFVPMTGAIARGED